jgi:tRNA threonylcarbamoyladenosine biosynthesis protein TsaE
MTHLIESTQETFDLARRMAEQWVGHGMIALIGSMGAGKTHFSKGFAAGLGFTGEVTSPTFALLHEYRGGKSPLFHFDWYRVNSAHEILELGWDDYESQGILLVEWADLFPCLWPSDITIVRIEMLDRGRKVFVEQSKS